MTVSVESPEEGDMDYTRLDMSRSPPVSSGYTVDGAIEAAGMGRFQYMLLLLTGICWTAESMEMLLLSFIKQPLQCQWGISDAAAAAITTSVGVGMLIGSTAWGVVADRFGRRVAFIASTAFTFLLGLASALSPNYLILLLTRGGVGFGIGGVPVSFSIVMEFLPASQRGVWGMGFAVFWSLGAIFEAAVAMAVLPTLGWRALVAISSAPLGFVLLLSFFVPESPRWLASRGRMDAARVAVSRVAATNRTELPEGELVSAVSDIARKPSSKDLLRRGARTLAFKVFVLWFVAAFVYYGLVMLQPELIAAEKGGRRCNYGARECKKISEQGKCDDNDLCNWGTGGQCVPSPPVGSATTQVRRLFETRNGKIMHSSIKQSLAEAKGEEAKPRADGNDEGEKNAACANQLTRSDFVETLLASVGELPGVVLAFVVINVIGRRPVIGASFAGTGVIFLLLLWCIGRAGETASFFLGRGASTAAFQGTYVYTNEIYPAQIRATATGVSSSIARIGLILTPLVAQYLSNVNLSLAMGLYCGLSLFGAITVFFIPIETSGRQLLDSMDQLLDELQGLKEPVSAHEEDDENKMEGDFGPAVS